MARWILLLVAGAALASAPAAAAEEICAGADGCEHTTAAGAFDAAAAQAGPDTVVLIGIEEEGTFTDAGDELTVIGGGSALRSPAGSSAPVLDLTNADSVVRGLVLQGDVWTAGALEDVAVDGALDVGCTPDEDSASARHLTVTGPLAVGCTEPGGTASLTLADSLLLGDVTEGPAGALTTRYCAYTAAASHTPGTGDRVVTDPGLAADGLRPAPGSLLIEAGDPAPLGPAEPLEDADGRPRMADGDGNGSARRDIGAFEHHQAPRPPEPGNLLRNAGAEEGVAGWQAAGMSALAYGFEFFPSVAAGDALGGGQRFFAGDQVASGSLRQDIDLRPWAPEIDAGTAQMTLSLLLGGYRTDGDVGTAVVSFTGPDGAPVGSTLSPSTVTPAARGNAITLLRRSATAGVPILARSATVTLTALRAGDTGYADAYFDDLRLTLHAPPGQPPPPPPPPPPPDPTLRPFAGVAVLAPSLRANRAGRVRLRIGCHDATVGRCAGTLTLVAVLRSDTLPRRIASAGFALLPGQMRSVRMRLTAAARRTLRRKRRRRLKATLYAAARDGQGLTVTSTSPLVLKKRRPRRR